MSLRPTRSTAWLLALVAYVPALIAAPGRMPADSKLYLYLDPGGFLADAASSFDRGQFAGWVPHQHISYLWPAGPWFWLFETAGAPDWIAHRLWIGTLMLAAGLGVRWCGRALGLAPGAALVAGLAYQVSPYVLPYVSRTSVMLLPWAGLGWIVGWTVLATRRRTWREPAAIALIVATVGAVNATALAMIVPAPALWLVHEAWRRSIGWRDAAVVAARTAVLSVGVSLWWVAALAIQGRYGAEVLPYSESLADVSLTSTSAEVWRGLGYWLFYVRDPYAATTTASLRYLVSTPAILVSFVVPVACLVGLVWVRWVHRRFAALLIATGGVLAVGVHPIGDRNLLMRLLTGGGDDGLALALRSSTRALPVMSLGLALALGAALTSIPAAWRFRGVRVDAVAPAFAALLVLANLPGIWTGAFVDPALERDQDPPPAWRDGAAALDRSGSGRVLMLPGAEFGAYRWGYTVDQPLPGLTDRPLVTRDLLPLGSPAAMDLLFALDDRLQDGVAEPATFAPVARLLGVDTVWLANDLAFDRFRTARPEIVRDLVLGADGFGDATAFGDAVSNDPDVPMFDETAVADARVGSPAPPVELVPLVDGAPLARAYDSTLLVAGSGDGLVDAAAAGLLPIGVGVRYVADDPEVDPTVVGQLVTDSNRDRARHWRSSQDTTGATEPGGPGNGLLAPAVGDARLPVFEQQDPGVQTVAEQRGPVTATATSYGEPFAYLPEHRPVMAIDGDPDTAWSVGEHGDPIGQVLQLRTTTPLTGDRLMRIRQPGSDGARRITELGVTAYSADGSVELDERVALDDRSVSVEGQAISLAGLSGTAWIDLTITAVGGGAPGTAGAAAGVGLIEVDLGLGATTEWIRPPVPVPDGADDSPLAHLFTRLRVDPMDRWRDDAEPRLRRRWDTVADRTVEVTPTIRIDRRAPDSELADLFGWPVVADRRLTGSLRSVGAAAFDADPTTSWTTPFGEASGTVRLAGVDATIGSITVRQPDRRLSTATDLTLAAGSERRTVTLSVGEDGTATAAVAPPLAVAGELSLTFAAPEPSTTVDRRFGDVVTLPISIGEIEFDGAPHVDPIGARPWSAECVEVATLDGTPLRATVTLAGPGWLDGDAAAVDMCDATVELAAGTHELVGVDGVLVLDRILLDDGLADALATNGAPPGVEVVEDGRFGGEYRIEGCDDGCWFVHGEGVNAGFEAAADGRGLGGPQDTLDGGFGGWWLPGGTERVEVDWRPQRIQTLALLASLVAVLVGIALIALGRRRTDDAEVDPTAPVWTWERPPGALPGWAVVAAWSLPVLLLAGPVWAVLAAAGGGVAARVRRVPIAGLTLVATVGVVGLVVAIVERRDAPYPGGGWPSTFEPLHPIGMVALGIVVALALTERD